MVLAQTFYPHLLTWFQEAMVATKSKDRVEALHKMEEQLTKKERQEFFKRCYDSHEEEFVRTVEDVEQAINKGCMYGFAMTVEDAAYLKDHCYVTDEKYRMLAKKFGWPSIREVKK